jgi:hypothetical protein
VLQFQPSLPPAGFIEAGSSWTLIAGIFSFGGAVGNSGTVTLMPNTVFAPVGDAATHEGYVQWGNNSATYLLGGSALVSALQPILIQGGTLATVWADGISSGTATVAAPTVEVSGGDIYVCMQQGLHVNFGELLIDGNLEWSGGTFHPYVYVGGGINDDWRTISPNFAGTFTISGGTVAPVYLDSDHGTSSSPFSGDLWQVLKAGGGFADNTSPSVNNTTLWRMQIDTEASPPIYWEMIAN